MNIGNVFNIRKTQRLQAVEVGVYAVSAVSLLGRLLFLSASVTHVDALLALAGEVFGVMAFCALSPVSDWLASEGQASRVMRAIRLFPSDRPGAEASNDAEGRDTRYAA